MAFKVLTDTSANIPGSYLREHDVQVVPFTYQYDGENHICMDVEEFDGEAFYDKVKKGLVVTTAQVNPQNYIDFFTPYLKDGFDIIYVAMASGISGSYASANIAANELADEFPERKVTVIDAMTASLGQAITVFRGVECRDKGMSYDDTVEFLSKLVLRVHSIFTVDDLMCLRRGGRLSNLGAVAGTILNIKPILKGNENAKIVSTRKIRGRKKSIETLAEMYDNLVRDPQDQIVYIAHGACLKDAEMLAELLRRNNPPKDIQIVMYEPVTGAHVGPGTVALFFESFEGVKYEN